MGSQDAYPTITKSIATASFAYSLALAFAWAPHPGKLYNTMFREVPGLSNSLFPPWLRYSLPSFIDFSDWYTNPVNWLAIGVVAAIAAIGWAVCHQYHAVAKKIAIATVIVAGWCLPGAPNPMFTRDMTLESQARLTADIAAARPKCVHVAGSHLGTFEFQIECMAAGLEDAVGGLKLQPDGQPDSEIQLGVTGGSGTISSIQIDLLGADGLAQGRWDASNSTAYWMVAVYRQDRAVVSSKATDLQLAVKAGDEIQLRITENSAVRTGKRFLVTVVMQGGHVATQTAVIP